MKTVRPRPRFNIIRKSPRVRPCRKVSADALNDVVNDVSDERTTKDGADAAACFCGEPFADNGQLLASLSPLLLSMKLFGLYFHRQRRPARRPTDDPEWNVATTTTTDAPSTRLRVYATIVLILIWLNAFRFVFLFSKSDHFGHLLLVKVMVFGWFGLQTIEYSAYYFANHSGRLLKVLETLPVTSDCVRDARRVAVGLTVVIWASNVTNMSILAYIYFCTDGHFDFTLAPFVTYVDIPEDMITVARLGSYLMYTFAFSGMLFAHEMSL